MANLDKELDELEKSINETEASVVKEVKSTFTIGSKNVNTNYLYAIGVLIPLILAAAMYFIKPTFVVKKEKGKKVVSWKSLLKFTVFIAILTWMGIGAYLYFN